MTGAGGAALPASWIRPLGGTGLSVSAVTAGGAPLGSMPDAFGYDVDEDAALAVVAAILDSPIRVIDTSNGYSDGRSEERIGKAIARAGGLPPDFQVFTKVDACGRDYSGERVRRSVRESKARLGLDRLPLVYLHDPEFHPFEELTAPGGAVETLVRLVEEGEIEHIGLAGGDVHRLAGYLELGVFEVLLTHNRWTIVDRSASELIEQAHARGMAVVNAAIYGGGILAHAGSGGRADSGARTGGGAGAGTSDRRIAGASRAGGPMPRYGYRAASPELLCAVEKMSMLARDHGTELRTVALQASLRDSRIASTVIGFSRPERIEGILRAASAELPAELWDSLEELVPAPEHWLDSEHSRQEITS